MKLMFYISTICNGGAARVMTNLANEMSERGHHCVLVTTFRADIEYELAKGVTRLSLYNDKPKGNWLCRNIAITERLRANVKAEKPDILLSFLGEPNFRAAIATIGTKTKTVLSVRNDPKWEYRGLIPSLLAKTLFRRADGMVFQTSDAQSWFPKSLQIKSQVIFNAVKEDFYNTELPAERSGIVATGRLSRQKNHSMLVAAYSKIARKVKDDLTIYGAGDSIELMRLAEKLGIGNRVHFPGQTMDVKNAIKSARLYVMSSDFEGMPNALMEAMAMGLPCVSTDCPCGGPSSLFSEEMKKYLTPVGDSDAMASTMLSLLTDDKERFSHGLRCKEAAKAFMPCIINNQWEQYLNTIVNK